MPLALRPAPVERGVVPREAIEGGAGVAESPEGEEQAVALGGFDGRAGLVETRSVDFGCGELAGGERGANGAAPAADHPVGLREREPNRVRDLPHALGGEEQALELVALRDPEPGREVVAVGAIQVWERAAQGRLQTGAALGRQGSGADGVRDQGNVEFGHFMSQMIYMTYFVTK